MSMQLLIAINITVIVLFGILGYRKGKRHGLESQGVVYGVIGAALLGLIGGSIAMLMMNKKIRGIARQQTMERRAVISERRVAARARREATAA